jgi:hypothetical protein
MALIEIDGTKLVEEKLMQVRIRQRGGGLARLILPSTNWNTTGQFLLHDLATGSITPVPNLVEVLRQQDLLEQCLAHET